MKTTEELNREYLEAQAEERENKKKATNCATVGCLVIFGAIAVVVVVALIVSAFDDTDNCNAQFEEDVWREGRAVLTFPDTFEYEFASTQSDNGDGTVTYGRAFSGANAFGVRTTFYATGIYDSNDCYALGGILITQ